MRIPWKLLFILSVFYFVACSGDPEDDAPDGYTSQVPNIPESYEFDLDDDGMADYKVEYWFHEIFSPTATLGITGRFNPSGDNEVLLKQQDRNLFLRDITEIKDEVSEPLFWNNIGFAENIISISNHYEKGWPLEWDINCDSEYDSYFLGLKLVKENSDVIGWVELEINKSNGHVVIVDKGVF